MSGWLTLDEAARVAQDAVEKNSCLEGSEARNYGCGVLEGYQIAHSLLRPGMPLSWTERDVRAVVDAALALREDDDDDDEEDDGAA